jgi:putative ABC transport system permease protein
MLDGLRQDISGSIRGLVKNPGFATAAILTLALGIGATSAMFSVVKAVLLTPLPYPEPERRVQIFSRWISFDKTWVADQELYDYRRRARTLTAIGAWSSSHQNLTGDGEPFRVGVGLVTANLFDVLGVRPAIGRSFASDEDVPNGPAVAVLGFELWTARYASDPALVGRTILLDDTPVQVIGVMPEGFRLPTDFTESAAEPTELWRPLQIDEKQLSRSHGLFAAALLAPGQTAATATHELHAITTQLAKEGAYPEAMNFTAFAVPLDDEIRGGVRPAMRLLVGAVAFLLLIACANVANLLLVRGDARVREMAVRTAIGASPDRVVRQLLTESGVLALAGALLGLALAWAAVRVLIANPTTLPPLAPVRLDIIVVTFTLGVGIVTTLVFGLVPAMHTMRLDLAESLREGGAQSTVGGARQRLRRLLVAAEVALAVILVVGAGLMIRSLAALGRVDLGFNPDRVLTMRLAIPSSHYDTDEKVVDFYRRLVESVRAAPGIMSAGIVRALPLATTIGDWGLDVDGYQEGPGRSAKGDWQIATDGAFEALGTRLIRGRWFTASDTTAAPLVTVVNETLARTYWTDIDAVIGGRIRVGNPTNPWVTVVGIVADERHNGVTGIVKEKFYIPHSQWHITTGADPIRNAFIVARTAGDPMQLARPIRDRIRTLDRDLPVANVRSMNEVVAASLSTARLTGFLLSAFAAIALTLAAVGIFGVLSYLVARRTQEIGIRMAIGADRARVVRLVIGEGAILAGAGVLAGVPAAVVLASLMQSILYEVRPTDGLTLLLVPSGLFLVALAASAVPAFRASRVSPLVALKSE